MLPQSPVPRSRNDVGGRQSQLDGAELANWLVSKDSPLQLVRPENIDRIETNLQIAHVAEIGDP